MKSPVKWVPVTTDQVVGLCLVVEQGLESETGACELIFIGKKRGEGRCCGGGGEWFVERSSKLFAWQKEPSWSDACRNSESDPYLPSWELCFATEIVIIRLFTPFRKTCFATAIIIVRFLLVLEKKMFRHRDCYGQTVTRLRNNYCFAADVVIVRLLLVLATITTKVSPQRLLSSDFYSSWEKLFRYRDWNRHFFFYSSLVLLQTLLSIRQK